MGSRQRRTVPVRSSEMQRTLRRGAAMAQAERKSDPVLRENPGTSINSTTNLDLRTQHRPPKGISLKKPGRVIGSRPIVIYDHSQPTPQQPVDTQEKRGEAKEKKIGSLI